MQLGALIPQNATGASPAAVRDYALTLESMGFDFLEVPDHVLGGKPAADDARAGVAEAIYHDPFVLIGFLAAVTTKLQFSTGVLIVAQRQTALVAKQAACVDILSNSRFRLGIGVGWNPVEFTGL